MKIKFSVIVPVYKTEKYLKQCIESILNQTYSKFELILVDDGSPDNCPQICDEYANKDTRVNVIHKPNGGLSSARNAGIEVVTGDYIIFIDSDDYLIDSNVFLTIQKNIDKEKHDILIIGMRKFYQENNIFVDTLDKNKLKKPIDIKELMQNNLYIASACDKVVKSDIIISNNLRFAESQLSEDIEWCISLLLSSESIGILEHSQYVYRQQNKDSISSNVGRKNLEDIMKVIGKYVGNENIFVRHFLSEQLVLWLTNSFYVPRHEILDLLHEANEYRSLLVYDWYPYVKMIRKIKIKNVMCLRLLLGYYRKIKQILIR